MVSIHESRQQIISILRAWGVSEAHAVTVAEVLSWADLHGIESHGISMLTMYDDWRKDGKLAIGVEPETLSETPVSLHLSGNGGFGHVAADLAMRVILKKARAGGLAVAAIAQSSHCGALGYYTEMAANAGLVGLMTTQTPGVRVPPTGGAEARLGTDPLSFSAPASDGRHFLLDMATTTVAYGKIRNRANEGALCPPGWVLTREGRPSTDPEDAVSRGGMMTTLGGTAENGSHKGYGLAAMVNILSSCLSGTTLSTAPDHCDRPNDLGQFFLALDPGLFRAPGAMEEDVATFCDVLRQTRPLAEDTPVMVAGDPERLKALTRAGSGFTLPAGLRRRLKGIAQEAGADWLLD